MGFRWGHGALVAAALGCGPDVEVLAPAGTSSGSGGGQPGPMTALPTGTAAETGTGTVATVTGDASDDGDPCPPGGCLDINIPDPECQMAADCVLHDSCCWCLAGALDDPPPDPCPADCGESMCDALGVTEATCSALFGPLNCLPSRDCDPAHADCDTPPPSCPDGMLPTVVDGCWSDCIPVRTCFGVGSCANCFEGDVCLSYPDRGLLVCVEPLAGCTDATCECLDPDVCELGPSYCEDDPSGPACYPAAP